MITTQSTKVPQLYNKGSSKKDKKTCGPELHRRPLPGGGFRGEQRCFSMSSIAGQVDSGTQARKGSGHRGAWLGGAPRVADQAAPARSPVSTTDSAQARPRACAPGGFWPLRICGPQTPRPAPRPHGGCSPTPAAVRARGQRMAGALLPLYPSICHGLHPKGTDFVLTHGLNPR